MAYGKRTYKKRSTMRKSRRRFNITRKAYIRRNAKVNHLMTQRFVQKAILTGSDVVSSGSASYTFQLNDLPSSSEFTSLFDQYQIVGIKYRWVVTQDPSTNSQTAASRQGAFPYIKWVHDHDDSAGATEQQLQQYPRMREFWFSESSKVTRWHYLKPAVATQAYGTLSNGYVAKWRQYLDCGYPGTPHYGIKAYYNVLNTGVNILMECKYVLKFKSVI